MPATTTALDAYYAIEVNTPEHTPDVILIALRPWIRLAALYRAIAADAATRQARGLTLASALTMSNEDVYFAAGVLSTLDALGIIAVANPIAWVRDEVERIVAVHEPTLLAYANSY